jgi:hypothetical protein
VAYEGVDFVQDLLCPWKKVLPGGREIQPFPSANDELHT